MDFFRFYATFIKKSIAHTLARGNPAAASVHAPWQRRRDLHANSQTRFEINICKCHKGFLGNPTICITKLVVVLPYKMSCQSLAVSEMQVQFLKRWSDVTSPLVCTLNQQWCIENISIVALRGSFHWFECPASNFHVCGSQKSAKVRRHSVRDCFCNCIPLLCRMRLSPNAVIWKLLTLLACLLISHVGKANFENNSPVLWHTANSTSSAFFSPQFAFVSNIIKL